MKINLAKQTVIGWPRETQRKRNICTFDYSIRVLNNRAGLTLIRPTGTTFSYINARQSSPSLILAIQKTLIHTKAKFICRTSHEPNRMQMRENKGFCSFAFDSAHVKYSIWTWPRQNFFKFSFKRCRWRRTSILIKFKTTIYAQWINIRF